MNLAQDEMRVARIRTSDRQTFKRCRRKWGFNSSVRMNLDAADRPSYFWIGTGGHFALEDFYGYNHYQHPVQALYAFHEACKITGDLPDDHEEQIALGAGILEHYMNWIQTRDQYETVWIDGEPQVELKIELELPISMPGYDKVLYVGTLDRLVQIDGEYWILDWKFYKNFMTDHLDWDQQLTAYTWLAQTVFEVPIAGAILHQFKKVLPDHPRILGSGKISTDKSQHTTHHMYREALIEMYGTVEKAPKANIDCLNEFAAMESEHRDKFIMRGHTRRNQAQLESEGSRILMEVEDMLNPDLPMYTNPTKDCSWDCGMNEICLMMDRDDDWEGLLREITVSRVEVQESWRKHLK